ncbi:MAG TPA: signal peptidase I [Gemmatimonadales bacterium]|nr:signal peptidase I [Gemmatimonadales bacterium]
MTTSTTPPASPAPAAPEHTTKEWLLEWAKSIGFALVVWLLLRTFLFEAFRIPSESMEDTLLVGDFLFVNKAVYGAEVPLVHWHTPKVRDPERGDIVVFRGVEEGHIMIVKRLIGLAGDTLEMRDHVIYRNGVAVDEPTVHYDSTAIADPPEYREKIRAWQVPHLVGRDTAGYWPDRNSWGPIVVPRDSLFVMGDNRDHSWDGRYWGFLPRENIRGTPLFIYYTYDPDTYKPLKFLTNIRWGRILHVPR